MRLVCNSILLLLLVGSVPCQAVSSGTVYLVVGSDTAIWNAGWTVDVYTRNPYYPQDSLTSSNAPIFQVMDPAWRQQFRDSFGQPIKFTWWMMAGNIYRDATNINVPLANTMTLHLMQKYHGAAIRQFGDELSLHYHTYMWSDYNGNGVYYWNQTRTFNERRDDFDVTLSQFLLEEGVFPASFRSGWHFMDQDWQSYLNQLIPYSFHNNYAAWVPWYTNLGPIAGVEDWSHAPSTFVPFHPSTNDYQLPGSGTGWNVRSVKIPNLTQPIVSQMFGQAAAGTDQVACFWDHLPENFVTNIAMLAGFLSKAASDYPGVQFRYCTAVEAMQRWRGLTNTAPPQLKVLEDFSSPTLNLVISSSAPIFQPRPFICCRDAFQQYHTLTSQCKAVGTNTWAVDLGLPTNLLARVAVAVTDEAGNVAIQTLRYLPDDLYLDNEDPQYSEAQENWTTTTNATWGTTSRVAVLQSNEMARASWLLPVSWQGLYRLAVQVPAFTNAATNVIFNVHQADKLLLSTLFPAGIPTRQWAFIGSVALDPSQTNWVDMVVNGTNQPGALAIADVLRMVPVSSATVPQMTDTSAPVFTAFSSGYLLRFTGQPGARYLIQTSAEVDTGWSTAQQVSAGTAGALEFLDYKPSIGSKFYRVTKE